MDSNQPRKKTSLHPTFLISLGLISLFVLTPLFFFGMIASMMSLNYEPTAVSREGIVTLKKGNWVGVLPTKKETLKSCAVAKNSQPYLLDNEAANSSENVAVFHADENADYTIICQTSQGEHVVPTVVNVGDKASVAPTYMTLKRIFIFGGTAIIFVTGIVFSIWGIVVRRRARKA
ncbi:MAG: hypothetical protein Q4P66_03225 [Actinomycetaceae bacterium]|nr:hypothetical protein [Actinomycetaceae bacterium]